MPCMAIESDRGQDMGPVQDRFCYRSSRVRLTNQSAQQYGFHSANTMIEQGRDESIQEKAQAIVQLATAAASDRGTVATLTTINAKLANQLETAHALIAQLKN
jgi:hypothetical protein